MEELELSVMNQLYLLLLRFLPELSGFLSKESLVIRLLLNDSDSYFLLFCWMTVFSSQFTLCKSCFLLSFWILYCCLAVPIFRAVSGSKQVCYNFWINSSILMTMSRMIDSSILIFLQMVSRLSMPIVRFNVSLLFFNYFMRFIVCQYVAMNYLFIIIILQAWAGYMYIGLEQIIKYEIQRNKKVFFVRLNFIYMRDHFFMKVIEEKISIELFFSNILFIRKAESLINPKIKLIFQSSNQINCDYLKISRMKMLKICRSVSKIPIFPAKSLLKANIAWLSSIQVQYCISFLIIFRYYQMQTDESLPKEALIKCLSAKEVKALVRPEFQANPDKYYPTQTFRKMGYTRAQCKCGTFYWRFSEEATTCGDSNCIGKYTFIGTGCGIGLQKKITYKEAWDSFERSLTSARIPCKKIDRYPVIARWRNDVEYVAAGIFCFQPYCVTGQMDPPANPLICPQFCLRFNDLDNIGLTGRHFSGFVMMGIQVFNKPGEFIFFKDECLEFNFRWLTEELKIDPKDITFTEDIWAGGGNLGPCVQYFIHGLQIGNMVFMQYKYDHQGKTEELPVKVIDVGIGLERVPWLINGSPTSYYDVFKNAFKFLQEKLEIPLSNQVWQKLGPFSCMLDIDEAEDIEKTWKDISQKCQLSVESIKESIMPVKDIYVILDHTRTVLMIITDGGLPSNTGGGSNCRNVLRRVFAILKKNGWWDKIGGIEGLLNLFQQHKLDLQELYGPFAQYKSFGDIIKIEHERWASTQTAQKKKLQQLLAKNKGVLSLDNWIMTIQSWGIPADVISQVCKQPVPDNLYAEIAGRAQKVAKATEIILYDTIHQTQTDNLYYKDHRLTSFDGKIVAVLQNVEQKQKGKNIVLLDRSAFYPTSGGQVHDLGTLSIGNKVHQVYDVQKIGKCFLHYLDSEVEDTVIGQQAHGVIDVERRNILRAFHTGTHIVYAAARRVLGPHVWQNGAKKTENYAHLDLTHYSSISKDIELQIENQANKIILQGHPITKYFQGKKQAQAKYGFNLYQGGIVPGNVIRVVNIQGVDVQACCGTHCDNTFQVGWIKIYKSSRISDGVLRIYYMANKKVLKSLNEETNVINNLKDLWGINQNQIVPTAKRFFQDYKRFEKETQSQKLNLLTMHVKYISQSKNDLFIVPSLEKELTLYFSSLKAHFPPVVENNKTVIFVNNQFFFGIISKPEHLDIETLKKIVGEDEDPEIVSKKFVIKKGIFGKKFQNAVQVSYVGNFKEKKILQFLVLAKFSLLK